ncbi:MAG: hypothetical protein GYA14_16745 [Ignavibacteria bacterium]|nr:hypothetical protein [Ignavibacteria bacterium]
MSGINYEVALYNTPFFENLVSELYRISRYKTNIFKKIKTVEDFNKKLSFEERMILKDLSKKENRIILEILSVKRWFDLPIETKNYFIQVLGEKYDSCPDFDEPDLQLNRLQTGSS